MNFIDVMIVLSAVYLAPHLDEGFARILGIVCALAAVGAAVYKVLV
jgi:predicted anti-sigma-YlaC factor YlaD